jgi:hypothetical protein
MDADELVDGRGRRYSADPAHYEPRCRYCQRRAVVDAAAPHRAARHPLALDGEHAARLYAAGASSRGIAVLMGVSHNTILRVLRARGVVIRPPVAPQRPRRRRRRPVARRHRTANHQAAASTPNPIFTNEKSMPSPEPIQRPTHHQRPSTKSYRTTPRDRSDQRISDPSVGAARPAGPRHPNHKINETGGSRSC